MYAIPKNPLGRAVKHVAGLGSKSVVVTTVQNSPAIPQQSPRVSDFVDTLHSKRNLLWTTKSIAGCQQLRHAHTDLHAHIPKYEGYRKESNPHISTRETEKNAFTYITVAASAIGGVYTAKSVVRNLISYVAPARDALAMAKVEVDLTEIPEGKNTVVKWRSKPIFIRHRTPQEIETERAVNLADLRDPQHDADRTQRSEWLILIGICTHLGCIPTSNTGSYGGYYCPCHGSHYDVSGRIRKGPAPLNLEVPQHSFPEENLLVIGS